MSDKDSKFLVVGGTESAHQRTWDHFAVIANHIKFPFFAEVLDFDMHTPDHVKQRRDAYKLDRDGRGMVHLHTEGLFHTAQKAFTDELAQGRADCYADLVNTKLFMPNCCDARSYHIDMTGSEVDDFMPLSADVHLRAKSSRLSDFQVGGGRFTGSFDGAQLIDFHMLDKAIMHDISSRSVHILRGEFDHVAFKHVTLDASDITGSMFKHCQFEDCHFTGTRFSGCHFTDCQFENCNINQSGLRSGTSFVDSDLRGLAGLETTKRDNNFTIKNCQFKNEETALLMRNAVARGEQPTHTPTPQIEPADKGGIVRIHADRHADSKAGGPSIVNDEPSRDPRDPLPPGVVRFQPRGKPNGDGS